MASSTLFHVARPIDKQDFLECYQRTTDVALLLLAPFGLLDDYDDYIDEDITKLYAAEYRQWEELVARKLFCAHGFQVDRIAASMHHYVEKLHDPEVFAVIEDAQHSLLTIIRTPAIVELVDAVEPPHIAAALERLIDTLRKTFAGVDIDSYKDEQVCTELGIHLIKRYITAPEVGSTKGSLSFASIRALQDALALPVDGQLRRLSLLQFTTYLDIFADSEELSDVFTKHGLPRGRMGLQLLRAGRGYINLVVHPLISFLFQVEHSEVLAEEECAVVSETCLLLLQTHRKVASSFDDEEADVSVEELSALDDSSVRDRVPTFLLALLLNDRARMLFRQGEEDMALQDCHRAIAMDARFAPAYTLRAECYGGVGQLSEAAIDSLAAFLLTGSSDMMLASTAELAAREMCRVPAKQEFQSRSTSLTEGALSPAAAEPIALPKEWFMRSYLAGYDCFQSAFQLDYYACHVKAALRGLECIPGDKDLLLSSAEGLLEPPVNLRDLDSAELRTHDVEAYEILCVLVYILDNIYAKSGTSVVKDIDVYMEQLLAVEEGAAVEIIAVDGLAALDLDRERQCVLVDALGVTPACSLPEARAVADDSDMEALFAILCDPRTVAVTGASWTPEGHLKAVHVADPYYNIDYDDMNEGVSEEYTPEVSPQLLARLMNVCASVAYVCGDTNGAIKCLRYSCYLDHRLVDSMVKLGSLLVDTDEMEEAAAVLEAAAEQDPINPFLCMHRAELWMNMNDFSSAIDSLRKGQGFCRSYVSGAAINSNAPPDVVSTKQAQDTFRIQELTANMSALLAVAMFRGDPANPERPLRSLMGVIKQSTTSINALLCYGEILSQAGDCVGGILAFRKCSVLDPSHPLPYLNTARTFTQMGQSELALAHIAHAQQLDASYCMLYIDMAQILLQMGKTKEALEQIDIALSKAKHVSEIRDVLTSRKIATVQMDLESIGLHRQIIYEDEAVVLATC